MTNNMLEVKQKIKKDLENLARLAATFSARLTDQPQKTGQKRPPSSKQKKTD